MSERPQPGPITEEQVVGYLQAHPDFFVGHEMLLERLQVPHPRTGQAISLIERQVELVREQKQQLKQQLQQLTLAARSNEALLERFQLLILNLIGSESIEQATGYIRESLQQEFDAEAVEVLLFERSSRSNHISADDPRLRPFSRILHGRQPVCGHLTGEQGRLLFGTHAKELASAVVVPLCGKGHQPCIGLLGIGSTDPRRYHPEMGTVFLGHLGAVMNRIFLAHLER